MKSTEVVKPTKSNQKVVSSVELVTSCSSIKDLQEKLAGCQRCKLGKTRTNLVFADGSPGAELMFVGEGPGQDEDLKGVPFVGRAGQLLTKMITAMGIERSQVYIANVVKCRPPENRNPEPDEIEQCSPFLRAQVRYVDPKIIVALGTFAAQTLLQTEEKISNLRGKIHSFENHKLIATYHPAYLLRNPSQKKYVWEDLQMAMKELGLKA